MAARKPPGIWASLLSVEARKSTDLPIPSAPEQTERWTYQLTGPDSSNVRHGPSGRQQVHRWARPVNPRTPAQQRQRAAFREGVAAWHELTLADRAALRDRAEPQRRGAFQLFMSEFLQAYTYPPDPPPPPPPLPPTAKETARIIRDAALEAWKALPTFERRRRRGPFGGRRRKAEEQFVREVQEARGAPQAALYPAGRQRYDGGTTYGSSLAIGQRYSGRTAYGGTATYS